MHSTPASRKLWGYVLVAFAAGTWGLWPLFFRAAEAIAPVDARFESLVLFAVLFLTLSPADLLTRSGTNRDRPRPARGDWLAMAWYGVSDALNVICFFAAYQKTTVAVAVLAHYLAPLIVALAAPLLLREPFKPRTLAAVAIALAGLGLLLGPRLRAPGAARLGGDDLAGALLGLASAVFYASNVLVTKRLARAFSPTAVMGHHSLLSFALLLAFAPPSGITADPRALAYVLAAALVGGTAGGLAFAAGVARVRASHAAVLTLLEPLVAMTVSALCFAEPLGVMGAAGAALILAGAVLVVAQPI